MQKLSPSMQGFCKLVPAKSVAVVAAPTVKKLTDEYLTTPDKKEKYKAMSKAMATKLAFKNLKTQLFKHNDAWQAINKDNTADSTESTSEGETTTSATSSANQA